MPAFAGWVLERSSTRMGRQVLLSVPPSVDRIAVNQARLRGQGDPGTWPCYALSSENTRGLLGWEPHSSFSCYKSVLPENAIDKRFHRVLFPSSGTDFNSSSGTDFFLIIVVVVFILGIFCFRGKLEMLEIPTSHPSWGARKSETEGEGGAPEEGSSRAGLVIRTAGVKRETPNVSL